MILLSFFLSRFDSFFIWILLLWIISNCSVLYIRVLWFLFFLILFYRITDRERSDHYRPLKVFELVGHMHIEFGTWFCINFIIIVILTVWDHLKFIGTTLLFQIPINKKRQRGKHFDCFDNYNCDTIQWVTCVSLQ